MLLRNQLHPLSEQVKYSSNSMFIRDDCTSQINVIIKHMIHQFKKARSTTQSFINILVVRAIVQARL
jgi:hypothetical protein